MRRLHRLLPCLFITLSLAVGPLSDALWSAAPHPEKQTTDTVLMVSPDDFAYNLETASSNAFQKQDAETATVPKRARAEFDAMVATLERAGVRVIRIASREDVKTPDAVFPNNWFSVHQRVNGERILVSYPMLAPNRRAERRTALLGEKLGAIGRPVSRNVDLSPWEEKGKFLEGTGSMVLDRVHRVAYASLSPRTDQEVLDDFCRRLGYRPVTFRSCDARGNLIYHTNVMMSIGERYAVICLEAIKDPLERKRAEKALQKAGKTIIPITLDQVDHMCGNILEVRGKEGSVIVMSRTACDHFTLEQKQQLAAFGKLAPMDIGVIETIGGGSARCMLGEVF